jgi:DNA polymerase III sliding clamp (beta) subunit (PCNA family)
MKAAGDLGSVAIELNRDSKVVLELKVEKESKATYSLSYLSEIVKAASPTADTAKVEFSTDMPIRLSFGLTQGHLIYYLAPRIE